jgi:hypothetical protein
MGRFKSTEIKGLYIQDFGKALGTALNDLIQNSELTKEQIAKKLAPKFPKIIKSYEETTASIYLQHHKFRIKEFLNGHFNKQRHIAFKHNKSFTYFILYINGCAILYEKACQQIQRKRIDSTLRTNLILYGLLVRRADQIVGELLTGNIDAAMILWRSLYENVIILLTLAAENDNALADKFYQHSHRGAHKKMLSYNKHSKELRFRPLPDSSEKSAQAVTDQLNEKYGKAFLDNEYGWADELFEGKKRANFRELEERAGMSMYRPYYLLCCEQTHANFNSLARYMAGSKVILPRLIEQSYDLQSYVDPMQFTLNILHEVNDYMLFEFSAPPEYEVNLLLQRKIIEKMVGTFSQKKPPVKRARKRT